MKTKIQSEELIVRRQQVERVRHDLKEQFLGLDTIIDEIMAMIMPWYLFPESQRRPTIVNLWGLTGSGKTALVHRLVELLDYTRLFTHLDMGEFESDSASWMREILTNDLEFFGGKPALICLDEFQFARTLDGSGQELGKDKLRVIWDLLDSGKIEYISGNNTYYLFRAENCLKRLKKIATGAVHLQDGVVTEGIELFRRTFDGFYFERDYQNNKPDAAYFLTSDFIEGMYNLFYDDRYSRSAIEALIRQGSITDLIALIYEGMRTRPATQTLDLSRALIFVLGNLDEAYPMSRNMNPDINADEFHEATARISIADIKRALSRRFRPEQIARLGNNHVIYRSFNSGHFRMLIRRELQRIRAFVQAQFDWDIVFDNSVVEIVYAEGVFPAQGTRPLFTTIKNLVESRVSSLVVTILEYQLEVHTIEWRYQAGAFCYRLIDNAGVCVREMTDPVALKLEELRASIDPEIQAHTAVHEAGHAVLAALTFRILPSVVASRTASDMEGFCLMNFPKGPMTRDSLKKDIITTLGGYVAERLIFGEEMTSSGVYYDIEEASRLATKAIREYAMGADPLHLAVQGSSRENSFEVSRTHEEEARSLILEAEQEAERILTRNKWLLLKMSEYLTVHSRMEEAMIGSFVRAFAADEWVREEGFKTRDTYYQFQSVLQAHIQQYEQESKQSDRVLQTQVMTN